MNLNNSSIEKIDEVISKICDSMNKPIWNSNVLDREEIMALTPVLKDLVIARAILAKSLT